MVAEEVTFNRCRPVESWCFDWPGWSQCQAISAPPRVSISAPIASLALSLRQARSSCFSPGGDDSFLLHHFSLISQDPSDHGKVYGVSLPKRTLGAKHWLLLSVAGSKTIWPCIHREYFSSSLVVLKCRKLYGNAIRSLPTKISSRHG
jgi:hypothetical protein